MTARHWFIAALAVAVIFIAAFIFGPYRTPDVGPESVTTTPPPAEQPAPQRETGPAAPAE